jgi:hypothetical protein
MKDLTPFGTSLSGIQPSTINNPGGQKNITNV